MSHLLHLPSTELCDGIRSDSEAWNRVLIRIVTDWTAECCITTRLSQAYGMDVNCCHHQDYYGYSGYDDCA